MLGERGEKCQRLRRRYFKEKKISNGENREGDIVSAENTGRNRGVSYR